MHEKKVVFPDNVGSMLLGDNILFLGWEDNTIRLYNIEVSGASIIVSVPSLFPTNVINSLKAP